MLRAVREGWESTFRGADPLLRSMLRRDRVSVLAFLVAIDLVFVGLNQLSFGTLPASLFRMAEDNSLAEFFQYGKALTIAWLLHRAGVERGSTSLRIWAGLFVYLALDDALQIHENLGGRLLGERWLLSSQGDDAYALGQLVFAAIAGLIVAGLLVVIWRRGDVRARGLTIVLTALLIGFTGAAVVVDFVDSLLDNGILSNIEEGGEMVMLSACVWAVVLETSDDEVSPTFAAR